VVQVSRSFLLLLRGNRGQERWWNGVRCYDAVAGGFKDLYGLELGEGTKNSSN
jgi:hypothetical protein